MTVPAADASDTTVMLEATTTMVICTEGAAR